MNRDQFLAAVENGGFKRTGTIKTPIGDLIVRALTEYEILEYGGELQNEDRVRVANFFCSLAVVDDAGGPLFQPPERPIADNPDELRFDPLLSKIPFGYRVACLNACLALSGITADVEGVTLANEVEAAKNA